MSDQEFRIRRRGRKRKRVRVKRREVPLTIREQENRK
jgi:hypothetical protein